MLPAGHDDRLTDDVLGTRAFRAAFQDLADHTAEKIAVGLDLASAGNRLYRRFSHDVIM
jgi:hypothetical protein